MVSNGSGGYLQEYFKLQPEGFKADDVFVCESRYSAKTKSFKKIKMWTMPPSSVRLAPRDVPLPVVRVASMFANARNNEQEKSAEMADEVRGAGVTAVIDKVRIQTILQLKTDG